jgi:LmbE family N-acetylglucosaminyl deacetylase
MKTPAEQKMKIKYRNYLRAIEYVRPFMNYSLTCETDIPEKKILLISANQADETAACAGTLIHHVKNGGSVETVFCVYENTKRMKEAEKASAAIGSKTNHFLQLPPKSLDGNDLFEKNLTAVFNKVKPEVVFLPFAIDANPDNAAVSKAIIKIKKKTKLHCIIYAYFASTFIAPNAVFDISGVWEEKQKAIECYKTICNEKDYVKTALGVNAYFAQLTGKAQYAEAFFKATSYEYAALAKEIL